MLDVGCGTGALTFAAASIPAVRAVGVDPSREFVEAAQRAAMATGCASRSATLRRCPSPTAEFDRTLSMLVLNFVPDAAAAVREMTG